MKCVLNWIPLKIRVRSRNTQSHLKVGLSISQTNADSEWNPVYNAFHRFFVVETKRFVGSFVNVILTRQTCGQRSSRAAESKRWALGSYFPERICDMFLMSKCRGDRDLGLCIFSILAKGEALRNGDFRKKTCFARRKNRNLALRSASLFVSTQKMHKPRSLSPLHFDIRNISQIRSGK